jgi:DNA mismatch repair ATPase MutS
MTASELRSFYKSRFDSFSQSLERVRSKINLISNIRLAVAAAILITFYFALTANGQLFYILVSEILVFIVLIRQHAGLFRTRTHLENLIKIQTNELAGLEGNYNVFDAGLQFIDPHHPYSHDLDIFGDGSLFQTINRCSTVSGKAELASRLSHPVLDESRIKDVQTGVAELSAQPEFCHELQAAGMEIGETQQDRAQLLEWLKHKPFLYGKSFFRIILWVLPVITISLLLLSVWIDGFGRFFWLCAAAQWAILGMNLKKVNEFHEYIGKKKNTLEKYAQLLRVVEKQKFKTSLLSDLQAKSHAAHLKVARLATLSRALDARLNSMMNLLVNSTIMFDLQCVYRLEEWKEDNAGSLEQWLNVVKEIEVIVSFGTFKFNNENFIFPKIDPSRSLAALGMGHPMIDESERIVNDVVLNGKESILIITGANMAGKSTFLRTLGVNVVLALAGAPVCSKEFDCPLIEIRSGMRTADSLKDHQSYFYAELNRLKSIVDELKTGKNLLILLDEILKGTNSTDKQAGSIALVKQLIGYPSLVLIATHDLVLGELETQYPQQIRNYCFEPSIVDDQLSFDYKLKRGIATKMNATFLMKKMGIIPR